MQNEVNQKANFVGVEHYWELFSVPMLPGSTHVLAEIIHSSSREHRHNDLKSDFPSADYVGNGRYAFNIRGNNYRLVAVIIFVGGILKIRFIGTHTEYDKIDCKSI